MKMTPGYHVERRGRFLVAVSDSPTATLTREMVEETREAIRRERAEAAATGSYRQLSAGPRGVLVAESEWCFIGHQEPEPDAAMRCRALRNSNSLPYQELES